MLGEKQMHALCTNGTIPVIDWPANSVDTRQYANLFGRRNSASPSFPFPWNCLKVNLNENLLRFLSSQGLLL